MSPLFVTGFAHFTLLQKLSNPPYLYNTPDIAMVIYIFSVLRIFKTLSQMLVAVLQVENVFLNHFLRLSILALLLVTPLLPTRCWFFSS